MAEDRDWESHFQSIVKGIDMADMSDPRVELDLWTLNRAVAGMNEAGAQIGLLMSEVLANSESTYPENLPAYLKEVIRITDSIIEILAECDCEACSIEQCENCPEDGLCDECIELYSDLIEDIEDEEDE